MKHYMSRFPSVARSAVFMLGVLLAGCGGDRATDEATEARLKQLVTQQWQQFSGNLPGGLSLAVITPDGSYFASSLENATLQSHFRAASTTKTFTAAAIMLLQQRGKLDIGHTLTSLIPGTSRPYVPDTADYAIPFKDQITIEQLLRHRAGVFDVGNRDVPASASAPYAGMRYGDWVEDTQGVQHTFSIDELVRVVASNQLVGSVPGEAFQYSNTGYSLLAKIIERVSGRTYAQFVREELLLPNGLNSTSFPDDGAQQTLPAPYLEGFTRVGGTVIPTTHRNVSWGVGEGNVVTTLADLARWNRRLMSGQAGLSQNTVARMRQCEPTQEVHVSYGLGIACDPPELGFGHNGGITGYLTTARHDPATQVTVVVMATLLDADDLMTEAMMVYDTARQAKALLQ